MRTVPGNSQRSFRRHLPRPAAPDAAGLYVTAAGFGGLFVLALLWITWAPPVLAGTIGAVTLVLLLAGVALPLLITTRNSP